MLWKGCRYLLAGVRAVDCLEIIGPSEQICKKQECSFLVFCVHPFELGFYRMAKPHISPPSKAQTSSRQSAAQHAPQLKCCKSFWCEKMDFFLLLISEMPKLFPLEKHTKTQDPENNSDLSEWRSIWPNTLVSKVINNHCLQESIWAVQVSFCQHPRGAHRPQWLGTWRKGHLHGAWAAGS